MFRAVVLLFILCPFSVSGQNVRIDSLRNELVHISSSEKQVDLLNEIAFLNISIDPLTAKDEVLKAYNIAKEVAYVGGQSRALVVMGGIHWSLADYDNALSHYLEALTNYEEQSDLLNQSICLNNIGEVYKKLGEYFKSMEYLSKALTLRINTLGENKSARAFYNVAEAYMLMADFEASSEYYSKAYEIATEQKNKSDLAYIFEGLGKLNAIKSNYQISVSNYLKAIELRDQLNDKRGMAYAYLNLGDTYMELNMFDSAKVNYTYSGQNAEQSSAADVQLKLYKSLSHLDSTNKDYQSAYLNFIQYANLKDSIYNSEKALQILRMQMEYENELLLQENEANEAAVKQRNTLIIAVLMMLLLASALAFTFNKRRSLQKKVNKTLSQKNIEIEKQHEEIQSQAAELRALNDNLASLNENLEAKIHLRTELLEEKNNELAKYAFFHAHELRAPLSNILGLTHLLKNHQLDQGAKETINHLFDATSQLDEIIKSIALKEADEQIAPKS